MTTDRPQPESEERVHAGYSQDRPRRGILYRLTTSTLIVGVLLACVAWARLVSPSGEDAAPGWAEEIPTVTLSPAEQHLADAMPDYEGAVPVVNFHAVTSRPDAQGAQTTPTERFARHVRALDRAGFTTITLRQLRDFLDGEGELPEKPIMLTFDDGHATTLEVIDPILARHGFTGVSFPATGSVPMRDTPSYYMTVEQVHELQATGRWEIGSHTHAQHDHGTDESGAEVSVLDHRVVRDGQLESTPQWQRRVEQDLQTSRDWLEREVAPSVPAFAYPFSQHGQGSNIDDAEQRLSGLLEDSGFQLGFVGQDGLPHRAILAGDDPMTLRRLPMLGSTTTTEMLRTISEAVPTTMPDTAADLRWTGTMAACETAEDAVRATLERDGYAECRNGATAVTWEDYTLSTTVSGTDADTSASVVVRDGQDWAQAGSVEVRLRGTDVELRERTQDEPVVLARGTVSASDEHEVRISVDGRQVSVTVDDAAPISAELSAAVPGGVTLAVAGADGDTVAFSGLDLGRTASR